MKNIDKDIKAGILYFKLFGYEPLSKSLQNEFQNLDYDTPFIKTNEDLGAIYRYFPIENSNVLTVIGSGDQILQAIKDNPKEVHAFDMNPLAIYMAKLKIASMQALEYNDYKKLFNYFYSDILSYYYKKIRIFLDNDACIFWDEITKQNIRLCQKRVCADESNIGFNSYEHINNYYLTKENISKTKIYYYVSRLFELCNIIPDIKFDTIILSNIYDWLDDNEKIEFLKFIRNNLRNFLTDDGLIDVYSPIKGTNLLFIPNELNMIADKVQIGDNYPIFIYKRQKY